MKSMDVAKNIRIRVQFEGWREYDWLDEHFGKRIGAPLFAWINKYDTIQDIINKHMKRIRKYIASCYKYNKQNESRKSITSNRWNGYVIHRWFDLKTDVLLFKISKIPPPFNSRNLTNCKTKLIDFSVVLKTPNSLQAKAQWRRGFILID